MNWRIVLYVLGLLNAALAGSMVVPAGIALFDGTTDLWAFLLAAALVLVPSGVAWFAFRHSPKRIGHREGFLIVSLGWFSACVVAALPFYLYGTFFGSAPEFRSFTNAFFESASGLTTTGATILNSIESLPRGILWWRSVIQWYGGMGIIVFSLALLPQLGVSAIHMMRAEVPGPTADKLTPRIQDTARVLWKVYLLVSLAETVSLIFAGMSPFDAFCHTFTTMATGGFSTKNKGIMAFAENKAILVVLIFFMFAAGVNFALHTVALVQRKPKVYLKDAEFKVFTVLIVGLSLAVFAWLVSARVYPSAFDALIHSVFNVVSLVTTTGYNSADFEAWGAAVPAIAWLVFLMMFLGGMSGSTGGAIKTVRIWVLVKAALREFRRSVHPHGVFKVRMGEKTVNENVVRSITGFFVLYMGLFFLGTAAVAASGEEFVTASSAVASCLGNVGPGLGEVGPTDNYYHLKDWVKWLLSVFMVIGRLELYTVLVLLYPAFWKK